MKDNRHFMRKKGLPRGRVNGADAHNGFVIQLDSNRGFKALRKKIKDTSSQGAIPRIIDPGNPLVALRDKLLDCFVRRKSLAPANLQRFQIHSWITHMVVGAETPRSRSPVAKTI